MVNWSKEELRAEVYDYLLYHACEGRLLTVGSIRDYLADYEVNPYEENELELLVERVNYDAICCTIGGEVMGAEVITTEDGYKFAIMGCGTVTDGDMTWPNIESFKETMANDGIQYSIERVI